MAKKENVTIKQIKNTPKDKDDDVESPMLKLL
jgi:hypothetical protein